MVKQPNDFAILHSSFTSDLTPVEVSACTIETTLVSGCSFKVSLNFSGSTGSPQGSSTRTSSPPMRLTFSAIRIPKTPFAQTTTLSPGSTRFTKALSIAADPGADNGSVYVFSVRKTLRICFLISSINRLNSGSKCPIVGFDIDAKILGCTSEGPGPISVLGVGENATITYRR